VHEGYEGIVNGGCGADARCPPGGGAARRGRNGENASRQRVHPGQCLAGPNTPERKAASSK
jgi:hypothetical protein